MFKRWVLSSAIIMLILSGCGSQGESKAKNTVEEYLDLMMIGNTSEANYLLDSTDGFIDVFSYEYLDLISEEDIENRFTMYQSEYDSFEFLVEEYGEWEDYYNRMSNIYSENTDYEFEGDPDAYFEYWKIGDTYKEYTLLYDMEIANGLGNKLYKKVEFTTTWDDLAWDGENYTERFLITNINIR